MRLSNKRKRGKATSMNSRFANTKKRQYIMDRTNSIHRRKERKFSRDVVKAYRASSDIPKEPPPTIGGFYAT